MAFVMIGGCGSEEKKPTGASSATPAVAHSDVTATISEEAPSGHTHQEGESAPHAHDEAEGPLVPLTASERETIGLKTVAATLQPLEDVRRFPGVIKPHPDQVAFVTSRTAGKRQVYTKLLVTRAGGPAMGGHTH
jgi:hypothetical protein